MSTILSTLEAFNQAGPSKEALRGGLQSHTKNSSFQWYTLGVDLRKVGFSRNRVCICRKQKQSYPRGNFVSPEANPKNQDKRS